MRRFGRNDLELLCVVLFWAFNVTVVKFSLREMQPLAFNILRFSCAAGVLLILTRWLEGPPRIGRGDLARMMLLGAVGHTIYQICFVEGLARTTASSTALIFGASPVVVGILSRLAGHERIDWQGGVGSLAAFYGVYLIVGARDGQTASTGPGAPEVAGNLLVLAAVVCWAVYTVLSRDLLRRHSPLRVTAVTLSIGTLLMWPAALPDLRRQDWSSVSGMTCGALAYSALFALVISYVFWYRSVKEVGNLRTAIYSNLVPVLGTAFGIWLLGERLTPGVALGAACVLGGILLTRLHPGRAGAAPAEEAGAASP